MKALLIVHGFVQGVGYRNLVRKVAVKNSVRGTVKNADNGTVEIIAEANDENLRAFEKEINVDMKNGPSVLSIEKHCEGDATFPVIAKVYEGFIIEH
jgi:acylphosphatase